MIPSAPPASPKSSRFFLIFELKKWNFIFISCVSSYFLLLKAVRTPPCEVTLRDISYACCRPLIDRAYGARVHCAVDREVRGEQAKKIGARLRFLIILRFSVLFSRLHLNGPPRLKH